MTKAPAKTMNLIRRDVKATKHNDVVHNMPCPQELIDFISYSARCQALCVNFGGLDRIKVIRYDEANLIENWITSSIYLNKSLDKTGNPNCCSEIMAKTVVTNLTECSKRYNEKEIHFSLIWIFIFDYEKKETKSLPSFKIYKNKEGEEALYMNGLFNDFFSNWDEFLAEIKTSNALLCVPRNGKYNFQQGQLDLEYVQRKCIQKLILFRPTCSLDCLPSSEVLILSWNTKLKNLLPQLSKKVVDSLTKIRNKVPVIIYITIAAVIVIVLFPHLVGGICWIDNLKDIFMMDKNKYWPYLSKFFLILLKSEIFSMTPMLKKAVMTLFEVLNQPTSNENIEKIIDMFLLLLKSYLPLIMKVNEDNKKNELGSKSILNSDLNSLTGTQGLPFDAAGSTKNVREFLDFLSLEDIASELFPQETCSLSDVEKQCANWQKNHLFL